FQGTLRDTVQRVDLQLVLRTDFWLPILPFQQGDLQIRSIEGQRDFAATERTSLRVNLVLVIRDEMDAEALLFAKPIREGGISGAQLPCRPVERGRVAARKQPAPIPRGGLTRGSDSYVEPGSLDRLNDERAASQNFDFTAEFTVGSPRNVELTGTCSRSTRSAIQFTQIQPSGGLELSFGNQCQQHH